MLKYVRIALWSMVALVAAYTLYAYIQVKDMDTAPMPLSTERVASNDDAATNGSFMPIAGLDPVGNFTLTDHEGKPFTQDSSAWQADYKLIYFGFTFCPMICPTELQKMTQVLNDLPANKSALIQPVFITIDPERDTAEAMAQYIESFHPRFIGLTGTPEQIAHMASLWKVYYAKVDDDSLSEYTMDHSSYIYLQGPEGDILGLFRMKDSAAEMTEYLAKIIP